MPCHPSGPFCGTISSKKKKKMMYLTTRNAGMFTFLRSPSELWNSFIISQCDIRSKCIILNELIHISTRLQGTAMRTLSAVTCRHYLNPDIHACTMTSVLYFMSIIYNKMNCLRFMLVLMKEQCDSWNYFFKNFDRNLCVISTEQNPFLWLCKSVMINGRCIPP